MIGKKVIEIIPPELGVWGQYGKQLTRISPQNWGFGGNMVYNL
ncbi:hypothetical protein M595_4661 [Lyngbya aestuarii BL J]|uniref:Uncharacterized protein n=1 Tax=Lyngbya aestuarii BL J TaxID=1348334 RepID=U7QDW8_9CYAN|nr:hypothetical protein M595_4661 [Lyngbya aestuarii BL J]